MARRRRGRAISGVLILDKPLLKSSNGALQQAKRLFDANKAGHTGSLDPLASGVLPLCFGEATKFSQYLLDSDKAYRSTFTLGVTTASGDVEGEVLSRQSADHITEADVQAALVNFQGEVEQVPSMYSALKYQGQPLYKLARKGIEVERKRRRVMLYELRLESFRAGEYPEIDIYVHCSKGTYVRSIAEDLGAALGCGAHVTALRRVQAGFFDESQAVTLECLESLKQADSFANLDALLLPVDIMLQDFPVVDVEDWAVDHLLHGQAVMIPKAPATGRFRLYGPNQQFLGLGEMNDDGLVKPSRLIATN